MGGSRSIKNPKIQTRSHIDRLVSASLANDQGFFLSLPCHPPLLVTMTLFFFLLRLSLTIVTVPPLLRMRMEETGADGWLLLLTWPGMTGMLSLQEKRSHGLPPQSG